VLNALFERNPCGKAAYEAFKQAREGKGTQQFIRGQSGTTSTNPEDADIYNKYVSSDPYTIPEPREALQEELEVVPPPPPPPLPPMIPFSYDPERSRVCFQPMPPFRQVCIVGGGFAALLAIARLGEAGFSDVRLIEKGGDVGGTWCLFLSTGRTTFFCFDAIYVCFRGAGIGIDTRVWRVTLRSILSCLSQVTNHDPNALTP